jgi:hypothetical protein
VQVRCLLEGVPVDDILADWHGLLQEYMQRWQLDRSKVASAYVDDVISTACSLLQRAAYGVVSSLAQTSTAVVLVFYGD